MDSKVKVKVTVCRHPQIPATFIETFFTIIVLKTSLVCPNNFYVSYCKISSNESFPPFQH